MVPEKTINERQLLNAVAVGDEHAFTELFHSYHPFLAEHLLRLTKSKEIMEEILQDTFMKIWVGRKNLSAVEKFPAYLLVASRNQALKALEKIARELQLREQYKEEAYLLEEETEDVNTIHTALIDEAIDALPERQRQVYLMHRHERLTYIQIAEKLGIGRETVKTHLEKAVKAIRQHVEGRIGLLILLFQIFRN